MRNQNIQSNVAKIIPATLWSGIIFLVCLVPGSTIPQDDWLDKIHFDKLVHAGLYLILFLLIIRISRKINAANLFAAGILCIAQGILIEILQESIVFLHRSFDIWDIAANTAGVLLAVFLAGKWYKTI